MGRTTVLTEEQVPLVNAALGDANRARAAWHEWERLSDWKDEQIDAGSHRLLALVYRNMARVYPQNPALPRLKGVYRKAWFENSRLWRLAVPAIQALEPTGMPVMLLKGVSLALLHYRDRGARAMEDVDLLVPQAQADTAAAILEEQGWKSIERASAGVVLRYHHSAPLHHADGGRIDLHRFVLAENVDPDVDLPVWRSAQPLPFEGMELLAPSAEDELIIACIHGWRWNTVPPVRWICDVATILQASTAFDWARVVSEARRRRMMYRVGRALAFASAYTSHIPPDVLSQLQAGPFAWFEAQEERLMNRRPGLVPLTGFQSAYKFLRVHGAPRTPRALYRFARHMVEAGGALSGPSSPFWPLALLRRRIRFLLRPRA